VRNYGNESNYRYGIVAGAPRILKLLDAHGVHASWTAAATALEKSPDLARAIVARGDEVISHGYRWIHQFKFDETRERDFIRAAVQSFTASTGQRPRGWLSRYLFTERTGRLLLEEGFTYWMDDYSDDKPFWKSVEMSDGSRQGIVIVPYALDSNDMKFWLSPGYNPHDWLSYAIDTFDWLYREGADAPRIMSLGLHLRIIGRAGRMAVLERFIQHVKAHGDVWIASRGEIAASFAAQQPFAGFNAAS
jgi:peptidoglycan/xylan/chitin deacetylase (PgdA/CDA1 family)